MTPFRTDRLILRNWTEGDRALFRFINADDEVMAFFPFRRTEAEADALMDRLADEIAGNGFGFAAIELSETGETAGFAGLSRTGDVPHLSGGAMEIGWRLAPRFWGRGIATEAARAWLARGFGELGFDRIVSFAVAGNHRSTAVMRRLGMTRRPEYDFDHPKVPDTHPELKRHVFYDLTADQFTAAVNP